MIIVSFLFVWKHGKILMSDIFALDVEHSRY